jgi:hypothetical protein
MSESNANVNQRYYFTFGYGHAYPNCYVVIEGTGATARQEMFRRFGARWAFQYTEEEFGTQARDWGMKEVV